MSVLVVGAHPDDETLGAGGAIARWTAEGRRVDLLVLGADTSSRGEAGAVATPDGPSECERAADVLGISRVRREHLPDNRFDRLELLEVVRRVEAVIEELRPSLVLTHHRGDLNVDHRIAHEAVLVATRPVPGCPVSTVLAFEVLSSTEWSFGVGETFAPNVFVDVTTTLETKVRALGQYRSEHRPAPHARSVEAVRALAQLRGATAGLPAAEAFELVRTVR